MSVQSAIDRLKVADTLNGLEFYVTKSDNKGPELHCRIQGGFALLTKNEVEQLAGRLNESIRSITKPLEIKMLKSARESISAELDPNDAT